MGLFSCSLFRASLEFAEKEFAGAIAKREKLIRNMIREQGLRKGGFL